MARLPALQPQVVPDTGEIDTSGWPTTPLSLQWVVARNAGVPVTHPDSDHRFPLVTLLPRFAKELFCMSVQHVHVPPRQRCLPVAGST